MFKGQRGHPSPIAASVLEGVTASVSGGPALALDTCARHLGLLGAAVERRGAETGSVGEVVTGERSRPDKPGPGVNLSWYGPGGWPSGTPGSEACIQAHSGLMELHGRDSGRPRRLGLEVASVAAGILATQGVLAGIVGRRRGLSLSAIHTSVLQAGCQLVTPYLAMATTPGWSRPPPSPTPGPPFLTLDNEWVELEVLDPDGWRAFWGRLGLEGPFLGRAWHTFRSRFETATCHLPPELHAAIAQCTLAQLGPIARASDVTLCRLRTPAEVVADGVISPWQIALGSTRSTAQRPANASNNEPLAGLRVVESTRRLQGPLAGHLLHVLGADVIRVEPPGGDLTRGLPPLAGDLGAVFVALNRGKQAVELDLKETAGRSGLLELIASADVFLHNWRPDRAAELDLDVEDCAKVNPALVYAHASGWGGVEGHPAVATDFVVQAAAGTGHFLSPPDEAPFPSRLAIVDLMGALVSVEAVLAGLVLRQSKDRGCRLESSLLGASLGLEAHALDMLASGRERGRLGGRPLWGRLDHPLETAEGLLTVTVEGQEGWTRLCHACQPKQATVEAVVKRFGDQPARHWEDVLLAAGVPAATVCTNLADLCPGRLGALLEPAEGCLVPARPWTWD